MFRRGIVVVFVFAILISGMLSGMDNKSVDVLIKKMEKATDPKDICKKIKSRIIKANISMPAQQMKMEMTTINKFPDKIKVITSIPQIMEIIKVCNGKQAWEYSQATGMREITGKELGALKLQLLIDNPSSKMREVFSKITVPDEMVKVDDFECYKMICKPNDLDLEPMIFYIDNKKYLMRKMEMIADTQMGQIPIISTFNKYKDFGDMVMATEAIVLQMGMKMVVTLTDVKNNVDIPDGEFKKPTVGKKLAPKKKSAVKE
jgi:outer membrane lipoprotein-sorting protein